MNGFSKTKQAAEKSVPGLFAQGALWNGEKAGSSHSVTLHEKLPALSFGAIHEWSLKEQLGGKYSFHPPLLILCAALKRAIREKKTPGKTILWIGERCWPTVPLLERLSEETGPEEWSWRKNSILINSNCKEQRLYALRKALASPAVLAVVGDAAGLSTTATRQLQLSARTGSALGLLVRPAAELEGTSCAQTKWCIDPYAAEPDAARKDRLLAYTGTPQWTVTLMRAPGLVAPQSWRFEWDEERFELRDVALSQMELPAESVSYAR